MLPSKARRRAFVRRHTTVRTLDDLPGIRLHVGGDVMAICRLAGEELGVADAELPYWAFPWVGGLAVARYLRDHRDAVAGKRVLDVASGSGLCAIVAARLGAASCRAVDLDPLSEAAVGLNAHLNGVHVAFSGIDVAAMPVPDCDVILAGDVFYEETMALGLLGWLEEAGRRGILPAGLRHLATYRVPATRELEDDSLKEAGVYTFAQA
jgi:predicted nicotinamide N-methyase